MQSKLHILPCVGSRLMPRELPSRRLNIGPNTVSSLSIDLFCVCFGLASLVVDNEAFVQAFAYQSAFVIGCNLEYKPAAVYLDKFRFRPDLHPLWGCGAMADVYKRAYRALSFFKVR